MSGKDTKEDWVGFAVALARALGALHAGVALALITPEKVPVVFCVLIGGGVFFLTGRVQTLTPKQTAALGYVAPVAAAVLVRLGVANLTDFGAAQAELLTFLLAVWRSTPVPCYLVCLVYALAKAERVPKKGPFDPPGR